jgi:fatty acid desaturase
LTRLNELRQTDNYTNWFYLGREYLFLMLVIGGTVTLYECFWTGPWSLLWAMPLTVFAIVCVGAGQHRLATFGHEAAHYMLFKNRVLNEIASEWFCMFPLFATTHQFRLQHFGHHQHANDPDLDPDVAQLRGSGHHFAFPLTLRQFLWRCVVLQVLWLPSLLRYVLCRASFQFERSAPALTVKRHASPILFLAAAIHYTALATALSVGIWHGESTFLYGAPALLLAGALALAALAPAGWFPEYALRSEISERFRLVLRWTHVSMLLCTITWLTAWTGSPWWLYYILLWLVPAGTSFAFFMMLGQVAQHGNAGTGRFDNTRIFLVHPLLRMAVFPIGNDYHTAHHLFMTVPHYYLPELHALLMETEPYRNQVTIVTGWFLHDETPMEHPTVVDLLTEAERPSAA